MEIQAITLAFTRIAMLYDRRNVNESSFLSKPKRFEAFTFTRNAGN